MQVQAFEAKSIPTIKTRAGEQTFTPDFAPSIMEVPATLGVGGLTLSSVKNLAVVRKIVGTLLDGSPMTKYMSASTKPTTSSLCATLSALGRGAPKVPIEFYDKARAKTLAVINTDSNGRAFFDFNYGSPGFQTTIETFTYPRAPVTISGLNYSSKLLSIWTIRLISKNSTDIWNRFQGRALNEELPREFWTKKPHTNIGLAGSLDFIELVPVVEGQTVRYEIGVSAYCNTPEPYPTEEKCREYRKNTWWEFHLFASNSAAEPKHIYGDLINIDYHLIYKITASSVSFVERKYVGT